MRYYLNDCRFSDFPKAKHALEHSRRVRYRRQVQQPEFERYVAFYGLPEGEYLEIEFEYNGTIAISTNVSDARASPLVQKIQKIVGGDLRTEDNKDEDEIRKIFGIL